MFALFDGKLEYIGTALSWVDFVLTLLLFAAALFLLLRVTKRVFPNAVIISLICISLLAWFFSMTLLHLTSLAALVIFVVVLLIINQSEVRSLTANSLGGRFSLHHQNPEKLFDRNALYQKVALAVENLSKNRIGAIITFFCLLIFCLI